MIYLFSKQAPRPFGPLPFLILRRKWDSNPQATFATYHFSRVALHPARFPPIFCNPNRTRTRTAKSVVLHAIQLHHRAIKKPFKFWFEGFIILTYDHNQTTLSFEERLDELDDIIIMFFILLYIKNFLSLLIYLYANIIKSFNSIKII